MPRRFASIVVLVEDNALGRFVYQYLLARGHHRRAITIKLASSGDGIRHVLSNYPLELAAYREAASRVTTALLAGVDADGCTVEQRMRQIDATVETPRARDERVIHLVPRRTIETWLLALNGRQVDEESSYVTQGRREVQTGSERIEVSRQFLESAVEALIVGDVLPPSCPSLQVARTELQRLRDRA